MTTTTLTVSTESDLDSAIQLVDEGGADAAANTAYTIDVAGPIDLGAGLPVVDLASGSSLTIAGTGGAQAETLGDGSEAGLVVSAGNVTLENLTIANAVAQQGGTLVIGAGATASGTVIQQGGTLDLQQGGVLAGSVAFAGGGTLEIDGTTMPTATISGFGTAGTIDLTGIAFDPAGSAALTSGNVLQISEDGQTVALQLDPAQSYAGHGFALASDGHGGTDVVDPIPGGNVDGGNGILTTLVSFNGTNGSEPFAGLVADAAGDLFGTTQHGGANDGYGGTAFEINTAPDFPNYASTPTTLMPFDGLNGDGYVPLGGLIADAAGDLFGTTQSGGAYGDGTVFEIANFEGFGRYLFGATTLASFNGTDGASPDGNLIADAAGDLFGTTQGGGASGDGTVFELANTGSGSYTLSTLASFDGANGADATRGLIADAAGDLFGTTQGGGAHGDGTVFELANTGSGSYTLRTLVSFNGTDGNTPDSGVIADAAGDLFGTTIYGGANTAGSLNNLGFGTVFELVNNGGSYTLKTLVSFNGANTFGNPNPNGAYPLAGLIADPVGNLFGTTSQGGESLPDQGLDGDGTVFELANNGGGSFASTPTTLVNFGFGVDGVSPGGGALIAHAIPDFSGVALFGTTQYGGANDQGTAFELIDPERIFSDRPTITGTKAGQTTTSEAPVTPFSGVTISDAPNATDTLTITVGELSIDGGPLYGMGGYLTGAGLSPVRFSPGVFTLSGTAVAITGELDALSFAPTGGGGSPNMTWTFTSTLTLSDVSSAYGIPVVTTTTVIDTDPAITDTTVPTETVGGPYSGNESTPITLGGLSVSASPNAGDPLTTVLSVGDGTLTAGGQTGGSITLSGTAAQIDTALGSASYQGGLDYYGPDTLSLTTTDTADGNQASATAAITVNEIIAPAGYYYPGAGNTAAIIDPVGTYTDMPGLSAPIPAPAGSYVPTAGATAATQDMPGTFTSTAGSGAASPAQPGSYVPTAGATAATQDMPGTFTSTAGSSAASPAPPGSYVPTAGATAATQDMPGTFTSTAGSSAALPAPPGSYVPTAGATATTQDMRGTFTSTAGSSAASPAPPGSYVPTAGATAATQDMPGTFTSTAGSSAASPAPPGSYVPTAGATAATQDMPGTFTSTAGSSAASPAPPGSYVPTAGATAATQDMPGAFTSTAGSSAASPAPPGSYVPTAGATAATQDMPGAFTSTAGSSAASPAPPGSYVPTAGATAATQDMPGTFTSTAGSSAASPAPPGSYVPTAGATAATLDQPGTFTSTAGSSAATPAPPGSYVATAGATAATLAPAGSYDPGYGNTAPIPVTAPDLGLLLGAGPAGADNWTNSNNPMFAGQAFPGSNVVLYDGATKIGNGQANAQGVWTITANTLPLGTNMITATATDPQGHTTTSAASDILMISGTSFQTSNNGTGSENANFQAASQNNTFQFGNGTVVVIATNGPNTVTGGGGRDTVHLGDGPDTVSLGNGNDTVTLGNGNNTVTLGSGTDSLTVGTGPNTINLGSGSYTVTAGGGNDIVSQTGNGGSAVLAGGNYSVSLSGNGDTLTLGNGNDSLTVSGTGTGEHIVAGSGNDTFTLGSSTTSLVMQGMHDTVSVIGGTDTLTDTSGGVDQLMLQVGGTVGGAVLGGTVSVANFSPAHGVLLLAQALATAENWLSPGAVDAALKTDNNGGSLLSLGAYGSVDFQNLPKSQLTANNFQFH